MLSKSQEDQIIQSYLQGYSRDEIAAMLGVAGGSVSNIILKWKKRIKIPDVEEIRQFMKTLRKSNLTLNQCSEGFRMSQLMNKFSTGRDDNIIDFDKNSFTIFVKELYNACKKNQILPSRLMTWFRDLAEFSYEYHVKSVSKGNSEIPRSDNLYYSESNRSIPLATTISSLIEEMKNEVQDCKEKKTKLVEEIDSNLIILDNLHKEISNLKQDKIHFLSIYSTFSMVDKNLKENCNIDLKTEVESFANLVNSFKEKGYDIRSIFDEYSRSAGLKWEITQKQSQIQSQQQSIIELQNDINHYESLLNTGKKNWDIFFELEKMKFGIKGLKQLWLTITEIATSNNREYATAIDAFIKDVEDNYHDKLRFEDKVMEKRKELDMINIQLKSNRQNLLLDPIIGSCLLSLFRNGITEQDIVELVQLFQNSLQENKLHIKDTSQGEKTVTDSYEFLQGNGGWKALVNELKKYDGIKEAVRHETMILKKLKAENSMIMRESKNLSELCQTTYHLISILDNYCSYFKGYFDQCQNKNTFNITLNNVLLPLIILANHHYSDNSQNKKENGSQDQNDMSEYNNKENDV
jgi:hypothetical protein